MSSDLHPFVDDLKSAIEAQAKAAERRALRAEINEAIRQHEIRVAIVSGSIGVPLLAATWWAILFLH